MKLDIAATRAVPGFTLAVTATFSAPVTGVVGPSGAGKTTISSLIPRLYDVTAGSLKLNGIDVRHATMQSIRDVVGVVTQDPYLFHDTLRANLVYARPEATEQEVRAALAHAQIGHLVAELTWPEADPALLVADSVTIAVQVGGKLRGTIEVPPDAAAELVVAAAEADPNVVRALEGKRIVKRVHVPNRIVNFVVAG